MAGYESHRPAGAAQHLTCAQRVAGTHLHQRALPWQRALEQQFHATAGCPARRQARGQHPGVVEHQQIPGPQQRGQLDELAVGVVSGGPIEHQQAAAGALGQRRLRDQLGGQ